MQILTSYFTDKVENSQNSLNQPFTNLYIAEN
nr:MAG TPA: hypothetical protein [Bacteriophage sp.]